MPSSITEKAFVPFLIAGMLLTGCANSIFTKYQDMQCVENCSDPDPRRRVVFEQPVWQTLQMFAGELLCAIPVVYSYLYLRFRPSPPQLVVTDEDEEREENDPVTDSGVKLGLMSERRKLSGWNILLLWIPAVCDLTGTTLMNVGLLYTPVSIYQMTRGALVIWVGLFSVIFLRRKLWLYQWLSLVTVMIGVSVVGLSGSLAKAEKSDATVIGLLSTPVDELPKSTTVFVGILFVLFAQLFTATQFVVEEKIMSTFSVPPLEAVGWEGFFGFFTVLLFFPIIVRYKSSSPFFDLSRGWQQMIGNSNVLWSSIAIAISIGFFNLFGLSVTRHVNATARSTADTCRTIGIWIVSLALGWEFLTWPWTALQVLGFALLVYGTFVFNNLALPPKFLRPSPSAMSLETPYQDEEEQRGLLAENSLETTATLPADLGTSGYDVVPPPERRS